MSVVISSVNIIRITKNRTFCKIYHLRFHNLLYCNIIALPTVLYTYILISNIRPWLHLCNIIHHQMTIFSGIVPLDLYGDDGGVDDDDDLGIPSFAQMHKYVPAASALVCVVSFCVCICVVAQRR